MVCGTAMILSVAHGNRSIRVDLANQRLELLNEGQVFERFLVSTSKYGPGEIFGSLKTPRGQHIIRAKIGAGQPLGTVFRGRRPTGDLYCDELARSEPGQDWILTRILWLSGTEVGRNRLGNVDTMRRYIYIHGTPSFEFLGEPRSIGCIRMSNQEIFELFDWVEVGMSVEIN